MLYRWRFRIWAVSDEQQQQQNSSSEVLASKRGKSLDPRLRGDDDQEQGQQQERVRVREQEQKQKWVPAFAGMTVGRFAAMGVPVRYGPGSQLSLERRWCGSPPWECPCAMGLGPGVRRDDDQERSTTPASHLDPHPHRPPSPPPSGPPLAVPPQRHEPDARRRQFLVTNPNSDDDLRAPARHSLTRANSPSQKHVAK